MSTTTERNDHTSRLSDPHRLFPELAGVIGSTFKMTQNGAIPPTTMSLVHLRAGQLAGSTYFTTMATGDLRKSGQAEERITAVATWRTAPYFTEAERVALELVEAVLTPNPFGERVSDDLYARAAAHYDEKALWTLILSMAQICFFIPVALIAKPVPGQAEPYNK